MTTRRLCFSILSTLGELNYILFLLLKKLFRSVLEYDMYGSLGPLLPTGKIHSQCCPIHAGRGSYNSGQLRWWQVAIFCAIDHYKLAPVQDEDSLALNESTNLPIFRTALK
jgi:hypothetical protein